MNSRVCQVSSHGLGKSCARRAVLQAGAIFLVDVDELYGKPLRQSTLAGSQVKLFLAIDDLETANYLSEMLGDTTVKVTTPIRCPGGGCHAALKYKRLDSDISVA